MGYNIRIFFFFNERELVRCYLIEILQNNLSFAYDFQRNKQVTQGKLTSLVLQNKLN